MSNVDAANKETTQCFACSKDIPLDAIYTPESTDYVERFCGRDCNQTF